MALFNIGGLGSGLDTNSMVDAYVAAKSYRLDIYKQEQTENTYKQEAYQTVNINLLGMQSMSAQLSSTELYKVFQASSSNESVASVTAGTSASKATYNLEVLQLATSTNVTSNRFTRSSEAVSSGSGIDLSASFAAAGFQQAPSVDGSVTFNMEGGGTKTFNMADYASVQDFLDDVNSSSEIGIKLDYSASEDGFRIRSTTGEAFTLSQTGTTGFFTSASMFPSTSSTGDVTSLGDLDVTKSFAQAGFDDDVDGTVTINGTTFDPLSYGTVQDFMDAVNNSSQAGVTLTYDETADSFTMTSDTPGKGFTLSETGTNGFFKAAKLSTLYSTAPDPAKNMESQAAKFLEPVQDSTFRINGVEFTIDASVDSINDTLREINESQAGVTAIYDYSSNTFNFTAKTEGDASISFTQVSGNFLSAIGVSDAADATAGIEKRGLNAEFILNGTTMTRTTNNFELSDLNFTLNGTGKSQVVVSQNTSAVVNMVEGFIEKYNSTLDYLDSVINETSVKDPQTEEQRKMGMLNSDPLLISIDSDLQSLLGTSVFEFDPVEGVSKSLGSLDEIGISSGGSIDQVVSGHLRLDSSKLVKALIEDPDRVAKMFAKDFVAIQGEAPTGAMDGSNKVFQLANDNVSLETSQRVQIVLNGTALTQVVDRSRTLNVDEFRMDYRSGSFELGATPVDTDSLLVNYAYTVDGGQEMGILARINKLLDNTTEVNTGSIETSVKSLRNSYTAMSERIKSEELRIESYREQMITIFTNLETSISDMNSQADYFASQMGASSSK